MRVLVTGAHGFLGSHLVPRLLDAGVRVRCLVRRPGVPAALSGLPVEVVRGDVRDTAGLRGALADVDDVVHLAARTRSFTRAEMLATNLGGTLALYDAARDAGLPGRFLFCSSLAAVGPGDHADGEGATPVTWYGESKARAEDALAQAAAGGGPAVTVVRPAAVYGPRDRDFLAVFRAARWGWLPLLGSNDPAYSFLYATDAAEALHVALRHPAAAGRTYFAAHPEAATARGFGGHAAEALGRRGRAFRIPEATLRLAARLSETGAQLTGRPPLLSRQRLREVLAGDYVCRATALTEDAGWRPLVDLAEGTRRTATWYREHRWL